MNKAKMMQKAIKERQNELDGSMFFDTKPTPVDNKTKKVQDKSKNASLLANQQTSKVVNKQSNKSASKQSSMEAKKQASKVVKKIDSNLLKKFASYLTQDTYKAWKIAAASRGVPDYELMQQAMEQFLKTNKQYE